MISASEITVRLLYSIPFHFLNNMEAADDVERFVCSTSNHVVVRTVRRVPQHCVTFFSSLVLISHFHISLFLLDARIFYLTYFSSFIHTVFNRYYYKPGLVHVLCLYRYFSPIPLMNNIIESCKMSIK